MARNKSKSFKYLSEHILIIFIGFFVVSIYIYKDLQLAFQFASINALIHFLIDFFIWRLYVSSIWLRKKDLKRLINIGKKIEFKYWEDKMFYTTIGLDQLLHYLTILILFYYLK